MKTWMAYCALTVCLAGCVVGGPPQTGMHLSPTQCRDLTAIRSNAPPDHQRNMSELAALREAGYDPSLWFDPYYPDDLQAAQAQVDRWYRTECQPVAPG